MNRIELVALFTSLESHVQKKDLESIEKIVNAVLNEASYTRCTENRGEDKAD